VECRAVTVRDRVPEGLQFVSSEPPAIVEGGELIWTLGDLGPGQSRTVQPVFRALHVGPVSNTASVVSDDGPRDQKTVVTEVVAPGLKVTKTGPATAAVGAAIPYEITVTNTGGAAATHVELSDTFDPGLEHESTKGNEVLLSFDELAPGQSRTLKLA